VVTVIPARITDGNVVPDAPLPPAENVRSVSVVVETTDPEQGAKKESTLPRLLGLLKDADISEDDYAQYLEEKYR
jgi:hypothetical protein